MRNKKKGPGLVYWCLSALLVLPGIAAADIVTDWSLITTQAVVTKGGRAGAVDFAIVHAAMFDAVNAIGRRYEPYKIVPSLTATGRLAGSCSGCCGAPGLDRTVSRAGGDTGCRLCRVARDAAE